MQYKYFTSIEFDTPIDDIKRIYHKLALQFHPDLGGSVEDMQQINAEYNDLLKHHQNYRRAANGSTYEKEPETPEKPDEFAEIIDALIKMQDVTIDLVGSWIWVDGNTKPHKNELKALGLKWHSKRQKWYLPPVKDRGKFRRNSKSSYAELCAKYGCFSFKDEPSAPIVRVASA